MTDPWVVWTRMARRQAIAYKKYARALKESDLRPEYARRAPSRLQRLRAAIFGRGR